MLDELAQVREDALAAVGAAKDLDELEETRQSLLGR